MGGGIGGLSAALTLRRFGHDPFILEQARKLRPTGAGISLWPNGVKVLNLLGLGPRVAELAGRMDRMAYADSDGQTLIDFSLAPLYDRVGERAYPIERTRLQELMLDAVGRDTVSLGARVSSVEEHDGRVTVSTEGGARVEADLVVAADGTHSSLRDHVVGRHVAREYVGYVNWNGLVTESSDVAPPGTWLTFVGEGKRASVMPVGSGRCYWFFDIPLPANAIEGLGETKEVLGRAFAGWAAPVQRLIERLDPTTVARAPSTTWPSFQCGDGTTWCSSATRPHSMAPDLGQGACQAMEDAWVLGHHLTATNRCIGDALERYQAERIPHTAAIMRRSRRRAEMVHGQDLEATAAWYRSLATDGYEAIVDGLAQSVETGPCR